MSLNIFHLMGRWGRGARLLRLLLITAAATWVRGAPVPSIDPASVIGPELPGWIQPLVVLPKLDVLPTDPLSPTRMLIAEQQIHIPAKEQFYHYALRVEAEAGLQQAGQVALGFAPSYQTLRWHFLRVWRDGRSRDALTPDAVQILRQEEDAERFTYHGRLSALAILRDIRVGDVIEYAFTRTGENPVFAGHFSTVLSGASSVPMDRVAYRILAAAGTELSIAVHGDGKLEHRVGTAGGLVEHTWTGAKIKPVRGLTDAPNWEIQYPFIEVTDYHSWAEVAEWGSQLFALPEELTPALKERLDALTAGLVTREEKANAVLRFVQDEVRYLAIHLGESSHRPSPPEEVLARRFGDCKDKSLLLVVLLRALGFDARVALVHSEWEGRVPSLQPSPMAFDHAIVRVVFPPTGSKAEAAAFKAPMRRGLIETASKDFWKTSQGIPYRPAESRLLPDQVEQLKPFGDSSPEELWIDSTRSLQGGAFTERSVSDFGSALVLAPGTSRLQSMAYVPEKMGSVHVSESYVVTDLAAPAALEVTTRYQGGTADFYRYYRRYSDPKQTAQQLNGLLVRFYPKIHASGETEWSDDRERNIVTVRSRFEVPEFWRVDAAGRNRFTEVTPWSISERLTRPDTVERAFAFALPFPQNVTHEIHLALPKAWPVKAEHSLLRDETFRFDFEARSEGTNVHLAYRWRTLADAVAPARMAEWTKKMSEVRAALGYQLTQNIRLAAEMKRTGVAWPLLGAGLAGLATGAALGLLLYRRRPAVVAEPPLLSSAHLAGISGWLILLAIGVTLRPFILAKGIWPIVTMIGNRPNWIALTDPESVGYTSGFFALGLVETGLSFVCLAWSIVLVPQFYRRRASFPRAFALYLLGIAVWVPTHEFWVEQVMGSSDAHTAREAFASAPRLSSWRRFGCPTCASHAG